MALLGLAAPAFADKVGVVFEGNAALEKAITGALAEGGHEIIEVPPAARNKQFDSVAAAAFGKKTGADIIVTGKKLGPVIVLKVLSTKNDTVVGATANSDGAAPGQVLTLIKENKAKLSE